MKFQYRPSCPAAVTALSLVLALGCTSSSTLPSIPATPGLSVIAGAPSGCGNLDGAARSARFANPASVTMDGAGNLYVADFQSGAIRKIAANGVVTTLEPAGTFACPLGVAMDGSGNLYVADNGQLGEPGNVYLIQGRGAPTALIASTDPGNPFNGPAGIAVDKNGQVYVADDSNDQVYILQEVSGTWTSTTLPGPFTGEGYVDVESVAVDSQLDVYVADAGRGEVYEVVPGATVATFVPGPAMGYYRPVGVAVDSQLNLYVADSGLQGVYELASGASAAFLLAGGNGLGNSQGGPGISGLGSSSNGTGANAGFSFDNEDAFGGLTVDAHGNVFVADFGNDVIREIVPATVGGSPSGTVTTLAGLAGVEGFEDGPYFAATFNFVDFSAPDLSAFAVDNVANYEAAVANVAVDRSGNIYVADTFNNTIRKIAPVGLVSTLAGTPGGEIRPAIASPSISFGGEEGEIDGPGATATFESPHGVAVDGAGNVYVADTVAGSIRMITPTGMVTTLLEPGSITGPMGLALDAQGNIYIVSNNAVSGGSSTDAGEVYMLNPATLALTTVGDSYSSGSATLSLSPAPTGLAVDAQGNVYVADAGNNNICVFTPVPANGGNPASWTGTLLAGTSAAGYTDNTTGALASFNMPLGLAVDGSGNVYVADSGNNAIRKITTTPTVQVGTRVGNANSFGIIAGPLPGTLYDPLAVAVNPANGALVITVPDGVLQAY